ncbi:MAG TPA: GNAT family N-acetyltransferase [Pyrinomonadaceae bacterium]
METSRSTAAAVVDVIPAPPEQAPVLANLLELYAHDFSEFVDLKLGPDGRFGYEHLPLYWEEPGRHPFLIQAGGQLAGFVLVRRGSEISRDAGAWDVAEFFVARGFRRLGVGTKAAHELWRKFPGRWEVRVMERNRKAKAFWERAVKDFVGEPVVPVTFDEGGTVWHVFSFESRPAA